jgi:type VI secretion system protein ImpK
MDGRIWTEILAAHRDVEGLIANAFEDPGARPDLAALRRDVWRRLDRLRVTLSASMSAEQAVRVLVPLLYLIDEKVLLRLGAGGGGTAPSWQLLQRAFQTEDGGDAFFDEVNALGHDTPAILFEVYLFCLQAGFEGRHAGEPEELDRYKQRLAEKIAAPLAPSAPPPASAVPALADTTRLALVILGAIATTCVILFAIAASL